MAHIPRPPTVYTHGVYAPIVVVPARVATRLERYVGEASSDYSRISPDQTRRPSTPGSGNRTTGQPLERTHQESVGGKGPHSPLAAPTTDFPANALHRSPIRTGQVMLTLLYYRSAQFPDPAKGPEDSVSSRWSLSLTKSGIRLLRPDPVRHAHKSH